MNLDHFRNKLEDRREKLKQEIEFYQREDPLASGPASSEVFDDSVTEIEEHDRISATASRLKKDLTEVEKALGRVENGTYGVCENCGQAIEEDRLEAMPTATTCLSCQNKSKG